MMVTVYEKDDCTACTNTKRHLERRGVPYETADIEDPGNMAAVKALGYLSAPVVIYGDDHWSGFRPDKINVIAERLKEENK